jgi:hypothetical protein
VTGIPFLARIVEMLTASDGFGLLNIRQPMRPKAPVSKITTAIFAAFDFFLIVSKPPSRKYTQYPKPRRRKTASVTPRTSKKQPFEGASV